MNKEMKPDIEGEMDEFQRISQDLRREEKIDISVEELVRSFDGLKEQTLTDDVWPKLENTESNEIEKGDIEAVNDIAKMYNKTNPKKLIKAIKSGDYHRPLILKMGDRYILIAGNTRLCTAAAMGVNPMVFIGEIGEDIKESMGAGSSGSFEGPVFSDVVLKKDIYKFHNSNLKEQQEEVKEVTDGSSSGGYDVPLFGSSKGRKNPLKIDGPDSIYKGRAVTDKKFPKWGGPDAVFVKIKDKCKKFPYCNQGDINALEIIKEDEEIQKAIMESSKKYGIPYHQMEKIVSNEINKIFI
jgi:hypothetical protein